MLRQLIIDAIVKLFAHFKLNGEELESLRQSLNNLFPTVNITIMSVLCMFEFIKGKKKVFYFKV